MNAEAQIIENMAGIDIRVVPTQVFDDPLFVVRLPNAAVHIDRQMWIATSCKPRILRGALRAAIRRHIEELQASLKILED
jgi:hypothetical protein